MFYVPYVSSKWGLVGYDTRSAFRCTSSPTRIKNSSGAPQRGRTIAYASSPPEGGRVSKVSKVSKVCKDGKTGRTGESGRTNKANRTNWMNRKKRKLIKKK